MLEHEFLSKRIYRCKHKQETQIAEPKGLIRVIREIRVLFSLEFRHKLNDDFIFFGWFGYAILGIEVFLEVYSNVADERLGEA